MTSSTQPRTLFLGLDGATFTVLDPLMERGVMPFLRDLTSRGARARLRSILPPLTPPAWTSLMTGKRPGQHGVFDFFQREAPNSELFHLATSHDIHSQTIWSLASEAGKRVISLNFPLMFPPPGVNGCVISGGWMPWRQLRLGCYPPGLFDRLKGLPAFNARELALDMEMEAKAIEGCDAGEYAEWIALHTRREGRWLDILTVLMQEETADLIGVVFDGVDKLQHLCWRFLDPALRPHEPSPWEREIIDGCEGYFRRLDEILAELAELAGPDSLVVLGSDHGFGPSTDMFYLNTWLEQQGFLQWSGQETGETSGEPKVGFGQLARHISQLDWQGTVAYAATPSSQGIHIAQSDADGRAPLSEDDYRRIQADIAARLMEARIPSSGRPLVSAVHTRQEAFAGPYQALAPDLTLELNDGVAISILRSGDVFRTLSEPRGNHRWDGVFLASGPGIRSGVELDALSIVDVAPLLLQHLRVPLPIDLAGRIPVEIFNAADLPTPIYAGHAHEDASEPQLIPVGADAQLDAGEEEIVLKRLRALGYMD